MQNFKEWRININLEIKRSTSWYQNSDIGIDSVTCRIYALVNTKYKRGKKPHPNRSKLRPKGEKVQVQVQVQVKEKYSNALNLLAPLNLNLNLNQTRSQCPLVDNNMYFFLRRLFVVGER
jgi:hypothetical protein